MLCIDEAHCIHDWYQFRPMYNHIKDIEKDFPNTPVCMITVTGRQEVIEDLRNNILNNSIVIKESV